MLQSGFENLLTTNENKKIFILGDKCKNSSKSLKKMSTVWSCDEIYQAIQFSLIAKIEAKVELFFGFLFFF
ncbi:hypothetical protein HX004_11010 [Myroides sp. 1354]|uniref:hypothetical protein n=1 Tax=unclassified Myroides TaxID=2642485 RepID=UPI002575ACB9|nr:MULTISPECIES: hypothetical protein [unclassified Myroides]MDM1044426.1 hypothetical protein [Myroides sp. R163-1]MDM1056300.1 hypothetical protein [Myroides sp. 1354]MDM1069344.1 hypothetical protein [Myroides sp. 1372]